MFFALLITFWYIWFGLIVLSTSVYLIICKSKGRKPSKQWTLFIISSTIWFYSIAAYEYRIYKYGDQWVTSSSDTTIRYSTFSIFIGYSLLLLSYIFLIRILKQKTKLPKWTSSIFILLIFCLFLKNSYCLVINYSGNVFYEFYFPEVETKIGSYIQENTINESKFTKNWTESKISKYELKDKVLTFYRPDKSDYKIDQYFLFWKLQIDSTFSSFYRQQ